MPAVVLREMVARGALEAVYPGVYRVPALPLDPMDDFILARRWGRRRGIISRPDGFAKGEDRLMATLPRKAEFQRPLQRRAAEIGQLPQRVVHLMYVGVVCAMLDEVRDPDDGHLFIVKGGNAMQLRLDIRARATTDLGVAFTGHVKE